MNYGFIYETTNLVNGKKYIGKHKRSGSQKDPDDSSYLGSGKLITRAIEKYGTKNFSRRILCECVDEADLQLKERYYIDLYNAVNSDRYYNVVPDANPPILSGDLAPMRNPETVKKVSEALIGRHFSDEHRKHISEAKQGVWSGNKNPKSIDPPVGESNPFYGKTHSADTRKRISEAASQRVGEKSPRYGAVLSKETKQRISGSLTGYTHTDEAKKHMREARAHQQVKRICKICSTEFIANSARAKYCPKCKESR